ncbi:MAG: T9SS type A sorting domain-containing protein [Bacteroidales bacterium]|nr:T9SS type A sorting domain-containing protein [Bacteroidales bacterium]
MKPKVLFPLLMLAAMASMSASLQAQTKLYTLTDGRVQWHEGGQSSSTLTEIGYYQGNPQYASDGTDVTYKLTRGVRYLRLNISNPSSPNFQSSTTFDEYCVWMSSGDVGYYWQEWDGYRYYLFGSPNDLRIEKVEVGKIPSTTTYWYKWNFGAGIDKSYVRNGEYEVVRYWMMHNGTNWVMSCAAAERPETIIYTSPDRNINNIERYCPDGNNSENPAGYGAVAMNVTLVEHPADIENHLSNVGLESINLSDDTIAYNGTIVADPKYYASAQGVYRVIPSYKEYIIESARDGVNLTEGNRVDDTYGSAGVPTTEVRYLYNGSLSNTPPAAVNMNLNPGDVAAAKYTLNNEAKRYLTISVGADHKATIQCVAPPTSEVVVDLTLTVTTTQGISETVTVPFKITPYLNRRIKEISENSALVAGAVFGGGRMADVEGNTDVTVHNCDTISYVYGGNDISGRVHGESNVLIGTELTTAAKPIDIGSVYGAGNGYYHYPTVSAGPGQPINVCQDQMAAQNIYDWNSTEVVAENSTALYIPTIKRTTVTINSNFAEIDTVFGGARNANIGGAGLAADDTTTSVRINKGIIFAVFGGNNVGGCMPTGTFSGLFVSGDSLGLDQPLPIINSHFTKFGREFGIRYVFGGGNKVFHNSAIRMHITGGMIDTVFGGGNSADVAHTICNVNCPTGGPRIYENPTVADSLASTWVGTRGRYNIRALFGGNNLAPMAIIPDLRLESGGVGVVYGGGNAGDMVYDGTSANGGTGADTTYGDILSAEFRDNLRKSLSYFTGDATNYIIRPQKVVSSYVHVLAGDSMSIDYLYGGCRSANVLNSTLVDIDGGTIGSVFGGCNIAGDVGSTIGGHGRGMAGTYVVINGGTILNNVFGGADGYYHCAEGEDLSAAKYVAGVNFTDNEGIEFDAFDEYIGLYRPTHNYTHLLINGGVVYGNVYGGGNHAAVGFLTNSFKRVSGGVEESPACEMLAGGIHFAITGGRVKGSVFGGSNMANIYGVSYVHALGDAVIEDALYGGNDRLGRVRSNRPFYSVLNPDNNYNMLASDGTLLNTTADASGTAKYATYIKIEGTPQISKVYGGGNGAYDYDGTRPEYPALEAICTSDEGLVLPIEESTFIDVHVDNGGHIDTIYGGGNAVGIEKDLKVLVNATSSAVDAVGTVFGGNNMANMETCVPQVELKTGVVGTVFGGSNMGHMKAFTDIKDVCGNDVEGVSSYVLINSEDITVTGYVFGGCNKADVAGKAFVDIRNTSADGIDTIFGGNDVSGIVRGNTRVDISGGTVKTVYGGSNGYYDYVQVDHDDYAVYKFNEGGNAAHLLYENSLGSPTVAETRVHIYGGTIQHNVYGGGRMGDCERTNVIIDDQALDCKPFQAIIHGRVYGGGEGDTARLDRVRRGNVTDSTHVELRHAHEVIAYAYGGGKGGDVFDANMRSYPTWDKSFQKIFGGCWGSDVHGTATLTLDANMAMLNADESIYTAEAVYGGNDFSGTVYYTNLTINNGRYGDVFGAGCGNYEDSRYLIGSSANTQDYDLKVPNSEFVIATFNDGVVKGTFYGGGELGTTFRYLRDDAGLFVLRSNGTKIADTNFDIYLTPGFTGLTQNYSHPIYQDPTGYSYTIVNVHGGTFEQDIFAGARGKDNQLIYGVKVLNMDGGLVKQSIYGGSQSVSDGYSRIECVDSTNTSLRPSSILNVVGGHVVNHVFGAGYKGFTHGSVYVNVGKEAVALSTVWDYAYAGADSAYAIFMPNHKGSLSDSLVADDILFDASIYAGANWGQSDGSYVFTNPGFFGGESRVLVDGKGYWQQSGSTDPQLDIANSIFGAGTSVLGGDHLSRIDIRNYGTIENCAATKELKSIQRAHSLYLHNTGIRYNGTPDANQALYSQDYSINRIDTVNTVGFNLLELAAPKSTIEFIRFFKDDDYIYDRTDGGNLTITSPLDLNQNPGSNCDADRTACQMLARINPDDRRLPGILAHDGITIDISKETTYGGVIGYAYLMADKGTKPVVTARIKTATANSDDGGFNSTCDSENQILSGSDWNPNDGTNGEMEYHTFYDGTTPLYRYWAPGGGLSTREVVILAHSNLEALGDTNKALGVYGTNLTNGGTGTSTKNNFAIAHAKLVLPPSTAGNYYRISTKGISVNPANDEISLVDVAWRPVNWNTLLDDSTSVETTGAWSMPNPKAPSTQADFFGEQGIHDGRNDHFGLVMVPLSGFETSSSDVYTAPAGVLGNFDNGGTVISTSKHVNVVNDYYSPRVAATDIKPEMDFYLTYDNDFFSSILGSVKFYLVEYSSSNMRTGDSIEVEVYISTILNEFRDMEYTLLAKYSMGKTNHYVRRSILPPTLATRDLYVTAVEWFPTEPDPKPSQPLVGPAQFSMTQTESTVLQHPTTDGYRYLINMVPVKNTDADNTSAVAWNTINADTTNVASLIVNDTNIHEVSAGTATSHLAVPVSPFYKVGILDGRGAAGLNFDLFYDGNFVPGYHGYFVGDVVLNMLAVDPTFDLEMLDLDNLPLGINKFKITLHIQVRPGGDTIYVASANSITVNGKTLNANNYTNTDDEKGKRPSKYVQTFEDAMSIYVPGDVICVLDTVSVTGNVVLRDIEDEETPIQVIRYDGHHHDAPGEEWVYRGTMIKVSGTGSQLTTHNVHFKGGAVAFNDFANCEPVGHERIQMSGREHHTADTNVAFGPIIAISSRGEVVLDNRTVVEENINLYNGPDKRRYGAINVTDGGTLTFHDSVAVRNNLNPLQSTVQDGDGNYYPVSGAVYVYGTGFTNSYPAVRFKNSDDGTKVTITDNYNYVPGQQFWKKVYADDNVSLFGYEFDGGAVSDNSPRNVFLTREAASSPDNMMKDGMSSFIRIDANHTPTKDTRVGISKWFPGEEVRDTIRFATGIQARLSNAYDEGIFSSDEGFNVLYKSGISTTTMYLSRCATFRHQLASSSVPIIRTIYPKEALEYVPDASATCPNGNDYIVYRVQGGFFPYTYTWTGDVTSSRQTTGNNSQVTGSDARLRAAIYDSVKVPAIQLSPSALEMPVNISVQASDLAGCMVSKQIEVVMVKDPTSTELFEKTGTVAHWTDTNSNVKAEGKRYYKGVKITPYAWPKREHGGDPTISAVVKDDDGNYVFYFDEGERKLTDAVFCEGDVINLAARATIESDCGGSSKFVMWDFNPYMPVEYRQSNYVVPAHDATVMAYYAPMDYWRDYSSTAAQVHYDSNYYLNTTVAATKDYVTTYNGDVHIYNEKGLGHFINVVNGTHNQTIRQFYFNKVFVHKKSDGTAYDMKCHKWTPVGTPQHPFRGWFQGVGAGLADTTALPLGEQVDIQNIIIDEPYMTSAGFFGYVDTARIRSIRFDGALVRGSQYVGVVAGHAEYPRVTNVVVFDSSNTSYSSTVLTTRNISGGLIGMSSKGKLAYNNVKAKFLGDAVYSGGMLGHSTSDTIANSVANNVSLLSGVYVGGIAGYLNGTAPVSAGLFRSKAPGALAHVANNYVRFESNGAAARAGGVAGYVRNAVLENNYVYGHVEALASAGGVGAMMTNGSRANNNYYAKADAKQAFGSTTSSAVVGDNAAFAGSGNAVILDERVNGVDNLTRVLNIWVRQQNANGGNYLTWTSDLDGSNNGYPYFGQPDMIPVHEVLTLEGCEEVIHEGVTYVTDQVLTHNYIDTVQMIDSTVSTIIRVHHATSTELTDTAQIGVDYEGHGFTVTAAESALLMRSLDEHGRASLVLTDTLQTEFGCDSVVTLTLTFTSEGIIDIAPKTQVNVYPNPTTDAVNVACDDMSRVEVYDNEGRRLMSNETYGNPVVTLSLAHYPTGIYYIRVHASTGVTIQKVIKR